MNRPGAAATFDEYGSGTAAGRVSRPTDDDASGASRIHSALTTRRRDAIHVDDKVARLQIEDRTSVAVDDGDVDGDHLDTALEARRLLILREGSLRGDQRDGDDNMKSSHNCTSGRSGPFFSV